LPGYQYRVYKKEDAEDKPMLQRHVQEIWLNISTRTVPL
jgi:hypothetical protein